jgi:hypothetical protein
MGNGRLDPRPGAVDKRQGAVRAGAVGGGGGVVGEDFALGARELVAGGADVATIDFVAA